MTGATWPARPAYAAGILAFAFCLGALRLAVPERGLYDTGPRALLDAAFALGFLGLTLVLAAGVGLTALRRISVSGLDGGETAVFAVALGVGVLAYGILALALAGFLTPAAILAWFCLVAVIVWREASAFAGVVADWLRGWPAAWRALGPGARAVAAAGAVIGISAVVQALTPATDYDGLMYHLQAPVLFLQAQRMYLLPDLWQANGPLTLEMLFTAGLAFGSDTYARLLHITCGVLVVASTFLFGRRSGGNHVGWMTVAILLGIPMLPLLAALAYIDLVWALWTFLALYALILWSHRHEDGLLVLAGLCAGLALGSKIVAPVGVGALGIVLLWDLRARPLRSTLGRLAHFCVPAALLALPWYAKNLLWAGNPLYPLVFGGPEWPTERLTLLNSYLTSFGAGKGPLDLLALPVLVFTQAQDFGTVFAGLDMPSLLFPLAILYPFGRRSHTQDLLALFTLTCLVVWPFGSQQTRLLLPVYPVLAVLAASVLLQMAEHTGIRRVGKLFMPALPGALIACTLILQLAFLTVALAPLVVLGFESKVTYLNRMLNTFRAYQFAQSQSQSPGGGRTLSMWDGRGYYCSPDCVVSGSQSAWTELVSSTSDTENLGALLRSRGIRYLLFTATDAVWMAEHDPGGAHRDSLHYFTRLFLPLCTRVVSSDRTAVIFEITCGQSASTQDTR